MIIAITGSGGFIGKHLSTFLQSKKHEVIAIPRIDANTVPSALAKMLEGTDVIINLAGAPVVGRWTTAYKKLLLDSRINTTRSLVEAIALMEAKPQLLISASAIGIYAPEGEHTESHYKVADDYLGEICQAWEAEAKKAMPYTRVAITRFGIVLGKSGGALKRMLPLFRKGLGGKIASGNQGFSWIHIFDVVHAIYFIINSKTAAGEFNLTSPQVTTNKVFTKILAKKFKKRAFLNVPVFALKLVFGEGAIAVAGGQFAKPEHLLKAGYAFDYTDLSDALEDIIS